MSFDYDYEQAEQLKAKSSQQRQCWAKAPPASWHWPGLQKLVQAHWRFFSPEILPQIMPPLFAEQPLERSRAEQFLFYPVEGRCAHKPNNSLSKVSIKISKTTPSETQACKQCTGAASTAGLGTSGLNYIFGILSAWTRERQPKLNNGEPKPGPGIRALSYLLRIRKDIGCSRVRNEGGEPVAFFWFWMPTDKYC